MQRRRFGKGLIAGGVAVVVSPRAGDAAPELVTAPDPQPGKPIAWRDLTFVAYDQHGLPAHRRNIGHAYWDTHNFYGWGVPPEERPQGPEAAITVMEVWSGDYLLMRECGRVPISARPQDSLTLEWDVDCRSGGRTHEWPDDVPGHARLFGV